MYRLLLIAPTCDGTDVGEAWVAHQWVKHLAARHDVTLLTYHKRGRQPAGQQLSNVRVVEWTEPPLVGKAERLNSLLKPGYLPFYLRARAWIKRALESGIAFDVVHQPVPVAMRYPSPAANLGIPLVVGPVGGGLTSPAAFVGEEGTAPWYTKLRRMDDWRLKYDPLIRSTYMNADCVIGIAPYVKESLAAIAVRRFEVMSETGLDTMPEELPRPSHRDSIRLLHVGRLVRTKGAREAVRAMGQLRDLPVTLDIIGDGPDRSAIEEIIHADSLSSVVRMHGTLPRQEVDKFYQEADIFVFPSYREPGGNVVFEAMGYSLPLIVVNRGGPGAATDDSCAIRLEATTPNQLTDAVAAAVRELVNDENRRLVMGRNARLHVADTALWKSKMDRIDDIYGSLVVAS